MTTIRGWLFTAIAILLLTGEACAVTAPQPTQAVDLDRLMGRWNEILRTPNLSQNKCVTAHQFWSRKGAAFAIAQHCTHADGKDTLFATDARDIDARDHAKFEASFFLGLIKKRYWIIDHDSDYSWMIASSADGKYVSALARAPNVSAAEREALLRRVAELGLNAAKLRDVEPAAAR